MKISYLIIALLTMVNSNVQSQTQNHNDIKNYVVQTKKIQQLKPILMAAEQLKKQHGIHTFNFKVIICGKEISQIIEPNIVNEYIDYAKKTGVELIACGYSLKKFKVNREKVPGYFKVVENGILYNLQLQEQGFINLSL